MENRRFPSAVTAVVLFFVLLFVYTKFVGPISFSVNNVNTNNSDLFQVDGTGKAAAAPDAATITIGITQSGQSVSDAQNKANSKADAIISALKSAGVEEKNIKTTNYSINPDYSFDTSQKITGYSVSQDLEVKTDISKINKAVDVSTANGANVVGAVQFSLNDNKQLDLENQAREEAVKNAKEKASGLASAAGVKLGRVINVVESQTGVVRPVPLEAKTTDTQASQPTNITPGQNNVEVTVTLTYQTL